MNIQQVSIGIHPINWVGEDVLEHGDHYSAEQVLGEIAALGLKGVENSRRFPKDPSILKNELDRRGLQLVSQWKSVFFSEPSRREEELAGYRRHAEFLKQMGCKVISTAEIGGSQHWDPRRSANEKEVKRLNDAEWESLAQGLNMAGEICKELDMKLVYHHHGGTVVEQPHEIDRLMEMTDPELVHLLFDTGHAYYGGNDPHELLNRHFHRVQYVHLKDIRLQVLQEAREQEYDFVSCIRRGVFTVPGDGNLDFYPIFKTLVERGYKGWAMIEGEQDPSVYDPFTLAKNALNYIQRIVTNTEGVAK